MLEAAFRGELDVLWSMGGDFREVMPAPELVESALRSVPLRVHQDIVLSSQMLLEPADVVVLLPAATRYEIPGGVTETSTERRVIFSPEIPGPRIGEARPEWEVFLEVARRVKSELADKLTFTGTGAIREEIPRAIPFYEGVQNLKKKGDNFQYSGPMLCVGPKFSTPDGKAHFKAVGLPQFTLSTGAFRVVTRRGKQFNSNVHEDIDAGNAAPRDAVLISPEDASRLGLGQGDPVSLKNSFGRFDGRVFLVPVKSRDTRGPLARGKRAGGSQSAFTARQDPGLQRNFCDPGTDHRNPVEDPGSPALNQRKDYDATNDEPEAAESLVARSRRRADAASLRSGVRMERVSGSVNEDLWVVDLRGYPDLFDIDSLPGLCGFSGRSVDEPGWPADGRYCGRVFVTVLEFRWRVFRLAGSGCFTLATVC